VYDLTFSARLLGPTALPAGQREATPNRCLSGARILLLAFLVAAGTLIAAPSAQAQLDYSARYRPPLDYRSFETEHFTFVFPAAEDTATVLVRNALEKHLKQTALITGRTLEGFELPVIVDPISDLANGFVGPVPFRTNIFTAHPTHALGAGFDSWAQTVAPHELTHAMHYDTDSGFGVGRLAGLFSEDLSRALYNFQPMGWFEGVAVYRESQIQPDAGRLHAPLATMKYRASLASDDPWSIGELMYRGAVERPANRHYLGAGQLVEYLVEDRGGTDFIRRTNQWYHRLPFLGFGMALWMGTGDLPFQVSDAFLASERQKERRRLDSLQNVSDPSLVASEDGLSIRRPYWLSDSTLVAHASGYSTRPGFYRINVRDGTRKAIRHENITLGRTYALGPDSSALYFARPHFAPIVRFKTVLKTHRLDLRSGTVQTVSPAEGTFTPAQAPEGPVWAAQREGSFSKLVTLQDGGSTTQVGTPGLQYKQVAPSPTGDTIAILANAAGRQGLYRVSPNASALLPWLRFETGPIYDVSWGSRGRYLFFSAAPSGIANVYALDTETDAVRRLTTVRYGALEPALSPSGKTLAFIRYQHERFELATLPFQPESAPYARGLERGWSMSPDVLLASTAPETAVAQSDDGETLGKEASSLTARSRPYRAWRHLAPRSVAPLLKTPSDLTERSVPTEDLGVGLGLQLAGVDPLGQWAYRAEGFYQANRAWGEVALETGLLPGTPSLSAFNRPLQGADRTEEGSRIEAFEERGVGLQVDLTFVLDKNVYETSLTAGVEGQFRQIRPISATSDPEARFRDAVTVLPSLTARYRLQKNVRDLMPNTGVISRTTASADALVPDGRTSSRHLLNETHLYWPLLSEHNIGLRTSAVVLTQNRGSLFNSQSFVPRGYSGTETALPDAGTHLRFGTRYVQPLWYVDTGSVLLDVAIDAVYGFGLAQAQYRIEEGFLTRFGERRASVGAGLGVQLRLFGLLPLNLEAGVSYRFDVNSTQDPWGPYVGPATL
jgi:hypothetical protein